MSWKVSQLGEVLVEARPGFASGKHADDGVTQLRMNNVSTDGRVVWDKVRKVPKPKKIQELLLQPGDIVFNATNSPELAGKSALFPGFEEPVTFSNHFIRLRVNKDLAEPAYVQRFINLRWQERLFERLCKRWVNQATVSKDSLLGLNLPLPPLAEQKRIAAILDQADALRRLRRQSIDRLNTLAQSVFYEMFGRFLYAGKTSLGEVANVRSSLVKPTEKDYKKLLHIGPEHIASGSGRINYQKVQSAELDGVTSGKYLFDQDCVLFSKIRPYLNKVALVNHSGLCSADMYAIEPNPKLTNKYFLKFLLMSEPFLMHAEQFSNRANIPKLNRGQVLSFQFDLPPKDAQEKFSKFVIENECQTRALEESDNRVVRLFASLQQRAFRGEL